MYIIDSKKVFMLAIGALAIFLGIISGVMNYQFMKKSVKTESTITEIISNNLTSINSIKKKRNKTSEYAIVKYIVNGNSYTSKLDFYSSTMRVGDKINIYYDPNNPSKISSGSYMFSIITIVIGAVFLGGIPLFCKRE